MRKRIKLPNLLEDIIQEVSIDQLRTQFVDSGKIESDVFQDIVDAVGNKTAYATWLVKKVADDTIKGEDAYKYKEYFDVFNRRKREFEYPDINRYKTTADVRKFVTTAIGLRDSEQEDPSTKKGVQKADKYKEFHIGSVDGFEVYEIPKGRKDLYAMSCELGSGAEWCTATGKTRSYFDEYIMEGPLFIFVKPGSREKYQFHYESGQFMDKDDQPIF